MSETNPIEPIGSRPLTGDHLFHDLYGEVIVICRWGCMACRVRVPSTGQNEIVLDSDLRKENGEGNGSPVGADGGQMMRCDICERLCVGHRYPIYPYHDIFDKVMVRLCRKCRRRPINELKWAYREKVGYVSIYNAESIGESPNASTGSEGGES